MSKKIIGVALGIAFLAGCYFQNKDELNIPEEDIKKISFLDLDENQEKFIYTLEDKSYVNNGKDKKVLNFKVLSKFKMKDKEYYIVEKDRKKGAVDEELKTVLAFNYTDLEKINNKYIKGIRDNNSYIIDIESYDMKGPYNSIYSMTAGDLIVVTENNENKYLTKDINEIKELNGKKLLFFRDNIAIIQKNGLFGMYDIKKKRSIPEINEEIYFSQDNILVKRDGKYYYNDEELKITRFYPTTSDVVIYDLEQGFGLFDLKNGKYSKEPYDEVAPNYDRYVIVGKDEKYGIIDKYNQENIRYEYDYINKLGKNSFIAGTDNIGMFALIVNDKKITEEEYENFIEINEEYYMGLVEDKYILIDKNGKIITKIKKNNLLYYNDEVVIVKDKDRQKFYLLESELK